MTIWEIYKKAKEFGIMPESALAMRIRFLRERIDFYKSVDTKCPLFESVLILRDAFEVCELTKYLLREKRKREDDITDEMLERARSTPIETILDFTRGKIRCIDPDHDDKHPSAYYGSKTNRLICPVCNKTWDAIACYQYAFSCDFKSAVKSLS